MKFPIFLVLIASSLSFVGCVAPDQSGETPESVYRAPDRISSQRDVQELHNDILRNDF